MGKVLRVASDVSGDDVYAYKDFGTNYTALYATFDVYLPTAFLAAGNTGVLGYFISGGDPDTTGITLLGIFYATATPEWQEEGGGSPVITSSATTPGAWHTISLAYHQSAAMHVQIDGTDFGAVGTGLGNTTSGIAFGLINPQHTTQPLYFRNFKIGTTGYGSSDLYSEDLSGGTTASFSGTTGDVTVIDDPTSDTTDVAGICFAFTNGPLDDPVTWTRVDNLTGVHVTEVSIDRGRGDERSKTNPGTVTIKGYDTVGALDPTNAGGAYYAHLKPVKQACVNLYNPVSADWHMIFRGYVDTYKYTLDPSEKFMQFEISLVDMLDMLNDAEIIPDQAGDTVPTESAGDCYYTGQHIDDRILAVLSDSSTAFMASVWPSSLLEIASGNVFVQGRVYARGTSLLQVIDEACDAEYPGSTNRFITKDGSFAFRGRYYRFVPEFYAAATDADRSAGHELVHWDIGDLAAYNADSSLSVCSGLVFELGKTDLINTCDVTPLGITDAQLASGSQFASDSTSITDYGPRTSGMSLENLITSTADDGNTGLQETATFSSATVHNYKDPVTFVSELTFKNPPQDGSNRETNTWAILCGLELSDLVTVTSTHPGGGGFAGVDHYVESIKYELTPFKGDTWNVTQTVGLSAKAHFTYMPASWNPPAVS